MEKVDSLHLSNRFRRPKKLRPEFNQDSDEDSQHKKKRKSKPKANTSYTYDSDEGG